MKLPIRTSSTFKSAAVGQCGHFVEIFRRNVPPLKFDDRVDRGPRRQRHGSEFDRRGPFDVDQIVEVLPHVLFQQGSVLVADFVGRSFQMEHRIAVDPLQPALAAAGDRFGPGRQRGREQKAKGEASARQLVERLVARGLLLDLARR